MAKFRGAIVPVTLFQQNCAILWDDASRRGLVVDPGGEPDRILEAIDQAGVTVERILLTHGHLDHAGGAAELADTLRKRAGDPAAIPIEGPDERDAFLLSGIEQQARAYGFAARNVAPNRWLHEGDAVTLGESRFDVLHCPGHTPGHIVFINRDARFALLGDVLFQGSVGRTDFPYGDHAALIDSIVSKLLPLGDDMQFLCGHGPGSTLGAERRSNPFLPR
ncbi:MAG TPA: MBL fold metallo-hydrolase [Acetobacteraceae bacterium]|nr:MBL fold metallo-hydrolase [Acetobacteraceae bacterium]